MDLLFPLFEYVNEKLNENTYEYSNNKTIKFTAKTQKYLMDFLWEEYLMNFICEVSSLLNNEDVRSLKDDNKEGEEDSLASLIINIYHKLDKEFYSESQKNKLCISDDKTEITIDYPCLLSLLLIIVRIIQVIGATEGKISKMLKENILSVPKEVDFKKELTLFTEEFVYKKPILQYLLVMNKIKQVNFKITSSSKEKPDEKNVLLLLLFFPYLFSSVESVTVDLTISEISNYCQYHQDPYKLNVGFFQKISEKTKSNIISNYMVIDIIKKIKGIKELKVKIEESYIIESLYIFKNKFKNDIKNEKLIQYYHSLLLTKLMSIKEIKNINLELNSLDPLLFKKFIELIVNNISSMEKFSVDLFHIRKNNPPNLRKILLNYDYFVSILKKYKELQEDEYSLYEINPSQSDLIIDYTNIPSLKTKPKKVVSEEKIPKYLYKYFEKNLSDLTFILGRVFSSLKELKICISPYPLLREYNNYMTAILIFIFNMLYLIQKSNTLNEVMIISKSFDLGQINGKIFRQLKKNKIDLKNSPISNLKIGIKNFFRLVSFDSLPFASLKILILEEATVFDLEELVKYFKENKASVNIEELRIDLSYTSVYPLETLNLLFTQAIPSNLLTLFLKVNNGIPIRNVLDFGKALYNSANKLNKNLYACYVGNIQELEVYKEEQKLQSLCGNMVNSYLKKNNIIKAVPSFESPTDFYIVFPQLIKENLFRYYAICKLFKGKNLGKNKALFFLQIFMFLGNDGITYDVKIE